MDAFYFAFGGYDSRIEGVHAQMEGMLGYAMSFVATIAFSGPYVYDDALAYN